MFKVGDVVKFREVVDAGDERARFVVTDVYDHRLIIRLVCDLPIPPTQVVNDSDVMLVD